MIETPKGDDEESAADDSDAPKSDTESDKADNAAAPAEPAAGGKGEIHYKDLVLDDVKGGVAATVSFGSIDMTGDAKSTGHFGKMSMNNLDIGRTLSFYGLVPAGTDNEMKTLYSNFTFEGGTFEFTSEKKAAEVSLWLLGSFRPNLAGKPEAAGQPS